MTNTRNKSGLWDDFRNAIHRRDDESGSITVEFVLWIPVFMVIIALTVDVSLMFLRQSNMWQVAQDTARQVSTRQIRTEANAVLYAIPRATYSGYTPEVRVTIDAGQEAVRVVISVPVKSVGVFGVLNIGGENDLVAVVTHRLEPVQ